MPRPGDTAKERIMARANAMSGKRKEENELTPQSYEMMLRDAQIGTTAKERLTSRAAAMGQVGRTQETAAPKVAETDNVQMSSGKFSVGKYAESLGRNFLHGVAGGLAGMGAQVEDVVGQGMNVLFPGAFPQGSGLFNALYNGRPDWKFFGKNGLVGIKGEQEYTQKMLSRETEKISDTGVGKIAKKAAEFGGEVAYGLGNAAPMAVEAVLTGGGSVALTGENLLKQGAEVVEKSGILPKLSQAARQTLTDKNYWTAFASEVGLDYQEALENGATVDEATRYSILAAGLNSIIEIGGGIQNVPEVPSFKTWLKAAHEEGMEEVEQGIVSRLMENAGYNKGNPLVGAADENAVLNPLTAAGEYAGGFAVGGIMSGGQHAIGEAADRRAENKAILEAYGPGQQSLVEESLEMNPGNRLAEQLKGQLEKGKDLSGRQLRRLIDQNETDLEGYRRAIRELAVSDQLARYGEEGDAESLAAALVKQADGAKLTGQERRLIEGSTYGQRIAEEMTDPQAKAHSSDWVSEMEGRVQRTWLEESDGQTQDAPAVETEEAPLRIDRINPETTDHRTVTGVTYDTETQELKAVVKGEDGEVGTIPMKEAATTLYQEELADRAADLKEAAPVLVAAYRVGQDVDTYARQFHNAYAYGQAGVPMEYVLKSRSVNALNRTQVELAYEQGVQEADRRRVQSSAKATGQDTALPFDTTGWRGSVSLEGATMGDTVYAPVRQESMTKRQKAAVAAMQSFAEATGIDVVFYQSGANRQGEYAGANGFYRDGTIYLDINSGKVRLGELGETAVLKTAAHELTHYIQDRNPEGYRQLRDFVVEKLTTESGADLDTLVERKQAGYERAGEVLSYEAALDEVAADGCEMMLRDTKAVEELAKENRSLAQKIRDWLRSWVGKIRNAMEGLTASSAEARALVDYAEELQRLWDDALVRAVRNEGRRTYAPAENGTEAQYQAKVGTDEERGKPIAERRGGNSKFSIRELSDGRRYVKADRQVLFGSNQESWSEQLEDYINGKIRRGQDVRLIAEDGDILLLTQTSAGKLSDNHTSDGRTMSDTAFERKANAAAHIDELVEVSSRGAKTTTDQNARHGDMASKGWNYRTAYFMDFDGKYYKTTISVAQGTDGSVIYNVGQMQERSAPQIDGSSGKPGAQRGNASDSSIRQSSGNSQEKNSGGTKFSLRDSTGRELTEAQQEYFKDSKVRDAEGNLLVMYHQTDGEFTVFDTKHKGAGSGDNETPFGIFLKKTARDIGIRGKKQMALYADIQNPLRVGTRAELVHKLRELSAEYAALKNEAAQLDKEYGQQFEVAKQTFVDFLTQWRKEHPDASSRAVYEAEGFDAAFNAEEEVLAEWTKKQDALALKAKEAATAALREHGYDGVFLERDQGSWGRSTEAYIALDAAQVKNTDNRTPTKASDIRFSLREQFPSEIDRWNRDGRPEGERFTLGSTGPVLQGLGAIESDIYMEGDKISTILREHPEMTLAEIKKIPQILEDPALVLKSKTRGSSIVVLGTYRAQNGKPILAAMNLQPRERRLVITDMQKVASAYTKTESENMTAEEKGRQFLKTSDVLFADKKRTATVLRRMGIQAPIGLLRNGYIGSISYKDGFVKTQGVPFSSVVKISETGDKSTLFSLREKYWRPSLSGEEWSLLNRRMSEEIKSGENFVDENTKWVYADEKGVQVFALYGIGDGTEATPLYAVGGKKAAAFKTDITDYVEGRKNADRNGQSADSWIEQFQSKKRSRGRNLSEAQEQTGTAGTADELYGGQQGRNPGGYSGRGTADQQGVKEKLSLREARISDRELLANALEGVARNENERGLLSWYRKEADRLRQLERYRDAAEQCLEDHRTGVKKLDAPALRRAEESARRYATMVSQADEKLLKLEAMKPVREMVQREREYATQRLNGAAAEKARYTADFEARLQEAQRKGEESLRQYRERREESERQQVLRRKIERTAKRLTEALNTNTDKKHIPEPLKEPIARLLTTLDFSSRRVLNGGSRTRADMEYLRAMEDIQGVLANQAQFEESGEGTDIFGGYLDLPEGFRELLEAHVRKARRAIEEGTPEQKTINRMGREELQNLDTILSVISRSVTTMNDLLANRKYSSVVDAAESSIHVMREMGPHKNQGKLMEAAERFGAWDNTQPWLAFRRFGDGGTAIFEGLQDGWDKLARNTKQILDFRKGLISDELARKWDTELHKVELTDQNGERAAVTLTTAQLMSLYCLSRREQAMGHLTGGGIRPAGVELTDSAKNRLVGKVLEQNEHFKLTREDLGQLLQLLTPEQISVARQMQKFMTEQGSQWGNEVSMVRFGYRAFTEQNYFPLETDRQDRPQKTGDSTEGSLYRLQNISAVKPLTKNANNAIMLRSIFEVFANHTADMAKYNAMVLPLLDAQKWYNYKTKSKNEAGQVTTRTVQREMMRTYGNRANQYVVQFLKDLNGVKESGARGEGPANRMISNYKRAAVAANLRVALLQPTSYVRATAVLDAKYLAKAFAEKTGTKRAKREMLDHSGIALWKSMGFFDTDVGRSIRDQIRGKGSKMEKLVDKSMAPAELGDSITWARLWRACKLEVQEKQKLSGEALLDATAQRFREVIYQTQVVDSTMTRSDMMRSSSTFGKLATSFMSEPTVSYNLLLSAADMIQSDSKRMGMKAALTKNLKPMLRAMQAYMLSGLAAAIVEAVADAFRDDEDRDYWWRWLDSFRDNLGSDLNPLNKLPYLRDAFNMLDGYGSGRMDTEAFSNLLKAKEIWLETYRLATGEQERASKSTYYGNMTTYGKLYQTFRALSQLTGLPVSSAMREGVTIWNTFVGAAHPTLKCRTYESKKLREAYDAYAKPEGIGYDVLENAMAYVRALESDKDQEGNTVSGSLKAKYVAYIQSLGLTERQEKAMWQALKQTGWSDKGTPWS